jgi:polyisoprenoid-binding protein YceI
MVSKTKGRFAGVSGTVTIAEDPLASSVEVEIDVASVDSRDEKRDEHLRSADFFHVEEHPTITFRSTKVTPAGSAWNVEGDLTVRGVVRSVPLTVTFEGAATSPWGSTSIGFAAHTELDREAFGLTWKLSTMASTCCRFWRVVNHRSARRCFGSDGEMWPRESDTGSGSIRKQARDYSICHKMSERNGISLGNSPISCRS